jgi:hypothetical protein
MDLAEHTDQPIPVVIKGKTYHFAELGIEAMGRLQAWIKANVPHPLKALQGQLEGFSPEDRALLLDAARKEAAHWPPKIGTQAAALALASSPEGMMEVLWEGLKGADPEFPRADAAKLFKAIRRDEAKSREVYGAIYGTTDDEGSGDDAPKA